MTAWPLMSLGDVMVHRKDFIQIDDSLKYKRCRVQLHAQGIVLRDEVPGIEIKTKAQQICQSGEFLVAEIDAKVGGFGIVPPDLDGAIVSSHYFLFDVNPALLDIRFLGYFVKTATFRDQVTAQGSTNYAAVRPSHVLAYTMPLPPIEEQRRIVERINAIGQKIGCLTTLRAEAAKETESSHRSAVEEVFLELSKRYGLSTVDRVCHSVTDGDHQTPRFSDEGIKFIFVGNASSGLLHFMGCKNVTPEYFSNLKRQRVPKRGDMLYTAVGATLGVAAVVDTDEPFCFQRHVAILKLDQSQIDSRFMWHMLRSQTVFRKAWDATTGSAQPTVPLRAIKQLPIPVPPLNEQRKVVDRLDELKGRMDRLTEHQDSTRMEIEALLPSVLNRAFHGELR